MKKKIPQSIMRGSAARIVLRTSMRIVTRNPIVLIPEVSARSAATKKIRPASTTTPIRRGMAAIGKKFAGTAAKSLTGARPTARILMVIGSIILRLSIAGMALVTTAAVVENINTVATAQARSIMSTTIRSTPWKSIAVSAIPTSAPALRKAIP